MGDGPPNAAQRPGPRRLFDATALLTGLRWGETAALEWRDLDGLDTDDPWLRLRAQTTKAARADEVPLFRNMARELCAARPPFAQSADKVFSTAPIRRTFLLDCQRAGIPICDDRGYSIDRHACRTTFTSWLQAVGVHGRTLTTLTRHAPKNLADGTYTDVRMLDLRQAIERLPDILEKIEIEELRATGTGGAVCAVRQALAPVVVLPVVQPADFSCRTVAQNVATTPEAAGGVVGVSGCGDTTWHASSLPGGMGDRGLEPLTSCMSSRRSSQLS